MHIYLGAIIVQGNAISDAKPVAVASRTTNAAEKNEILRQWQNILHSVGLDFISLEHLA